MRPPCVTAPAAIRPERRDRLISAKAFAKKRSKRSPAWGGATAARRIDCGTEAFMSTILPEPSSVPNPAATAKRNLMIGVCIALGVLIVIAFGGVIAGIILSGNTSSQQKGTAAHATASTPRPAVATLPAGDKIVEMQTQPGRLILHVRSATADEIDVVDLDDGRIVARIRAAAP